MREMSAHELRNHLLREQETLYVLQNKSLREQIERSLKTHGEGKGYRPSPGELDALDRV